MTSFVPLTDESMSKISASRSPPRVPPTKTGEEGTAKRNILRRNSKDKIQVTAVGVGGGGGHNSKNAPGAAIDDGSMYNDPYACDPGDPNYEDPAEADAGPDFNTIYQFSDNRTGVGSSLMTLTAYKRSVQPIVKEYFVNGDVSNLLEEVAELGAPEYGYELVKRSINMSLDQGDREREVRSCRRRRRRRRKRRRRLA